MTAEDWWVSLTNCKIHHAGVRAWNCPPEPHKPWLWKNCMTVHATGKGYFERCLVLLLFLPLIAWSFSASTALACSSVGSSGAGWVCPLGSLSVSLPTISQNPGASWTALLAVGELGCVSGVSPCRRDLSGFCCCFPASSLELPSPHPHTGASHAPTCISVHLLTAEEHSVLCPLQRVSSNPLARPQRSKVCSRSYPCPSSPSFWGLHGFRGAAVESCDWDPSLHPASVSAPQLNTADVLPLISEMRLGG